MEKTNQVLNSPGKGYIVHSQDPQNHNLNSIRQSNAAYKISGNNNKYQYNISKDSLIKISKDVFNPNSRLFDSTKKINLKKSMDDASEKKNESNPKVRYTIKSSNKLNFSTRVNSEDQLIFKQIKNQQPRSRNYYNNDDPKHNLSESINNKSLKNHSKVEDNTVAISKENSKVKYSIRNHFLPENFKQIQVKKGLKLDKNSLNGKPNMVKYNSINISESDYNQPVSTTNQTNVNRSGKYLQKENIITPNIDKSQKILLQRQPEFENFIKDKNTNNRPSYNQNCTQEVQRHSHMQKSVESNSTNRNHSINNSKLHGGNSKHYINLSYRNKSNPIVNQDFKVRQERGNTNDIATKEENIESNRNSEKMNAQRQNSLQYFATKNSRQKNKSNAVGNIKTISSTLNFANANHIRTGTGSLIVKNDLNIVSANNSGRANNNNQSGFNLGSVSNMAMPKQRISGVNIAQSKKNLHTSDISLKPQDKNVLNKQPQNKQNYNSNASYENINQQIQKQLENHNTYKRRSSHKSKNAIKAISNILNNHSNNGVAYMNQKTNQENESHISINAKRKLSQPNKNLLMKEGDNNTFARSQNNSQINLDGQQYVSGILSTKNSIIQKNHTLKSIENSPIYNKHGKNPLKNPSNLTVGQHHQLKTQKSTASTWKTIKLQWNASEAAYPNINKELQAISVQGKGSFATVYEAYDKRLKYNVAVKVYEKKDLNQPDRKSFVQNEVDIMANINHKYIAKYYRILEDSKAIYIVQEIGGEISLSEFVRQGKNKKLGEHDARILFKQLINSVKYLHDLKVCHRDLKLTNILVNEQTDLKLIDFGFSTIANRYFKTYCGTPSYMSPELVKKMEYDGIAVDLWAMGVIQYKMVTGDYPFGSEKDKFQNERILACDLKMPNYVSVECRNLIVSCLQQDPQNRITCAEMMDHAFTRGVEIKKNYKSSHHYSETFDKEDQY